MAEINNDEKRIGVSGEQIEEAVGKVPTIEADVKSNKQSISALQTASAQHTADISSVNATLENKANADEVYSREETDNAITAKVAEIVAGAPEEFDTLKEMSDWLTEHSGSAAEMNTAIQTNTKAIADNATAIEANTAEIANNKSDILKAENAVAVNRTTLGTQCKNLLNVTSITQEINGVTITVNSDKSITVNGTPTKDFYHYINRNADNSDPYIHKGKYIASGGSEQCYVYFRHGINVSGENGTLFSVKATDVLFTVANENELMRTFLYLRMSTTYDNVTVYPMIRLADITDDAYEPYKPSLQEQINALIERIQALETAPTQNE